MSEEAKGGEAPDPYMPKEESENVFTKAVKTVTFSNGYKNDGKDPSFKLLNSASMQASTALSGIPPGTKQNVVRGDSIHHYLKNVLTIIEEKDTLQVNGEQRVTVMQNTQHSYKANFLRGVSGNDHIRVNGIRDIIVLGSSSEQYVGKHEVNAPEEFEWKSLEGGFSLLKLDLMGAGWDMHGGNIELYGANVEAGIESAEGSVFHQEIPLAHEKESPLQSRQGAEIDLLLRADFLPDFGVGTPFR